MVTAPSPDRSRAGAAIEVADLCRRFVTGRGRNRRTVEAVQGVSFAVEAGERLAFIGPNGAGKSTSIKMLTGILLPTSGTARVLGLEPWSQRRELSRRVGTLFGQRSQLWSELPPRSSLRTLGAIFGLSDAGIGRRVAELGELLDAAELFDQPARTLSLGQRMRCELAACMLHQPSLLFLDEPTIGLDLLAKRRFRDVLIRLNTELGTTVFLTSHDVADIEHVAERAIIVNHGTVIHDSTVAQLRRDFLATKWVEIGLVNPLDGHTLAAALAAALTAGGGSEALTAGGGSEALTAGSGGGGGNSAVAIIERSDTTISLQVDTSRRPIGQVLDTVLATLTVADLSVVDPPLEHVIGELYARPRSR